jgi:gas vesicle protein
MIGICIVEDHNECKDLAILKNVVKIFNETEQLIREMMENIHKIRQNRENNSITVTEQKRIIEQEIRELREEINNHLDKLQEDLFKTVAVY